MDVASNTNTPTFVFADDAPYWQMARWERFALAALLQHLRPAIAIEVGTCQGGSLSVLSRYAATAYSIDIDPRSAANCSPQFDNVQFITGDSRMVLPELLSMLDRSGWGPEFVLIDGDHSADGVAADIENVLAFRPRRELHILIHDSFNPECRRGIVRVDWAECEFVHHVEIDFVPGAFHAIPVGDATSRSMWGGFAHALLRPVRRATALSLSQCQQTLFDLVLPHSIHAEAHALNAR